MGRRDEDLVERVHTRSKNRAGLSVVSEANPLLCNGLQSSDNQGDNSTRMLKLHEYHLERRRFFGDQQIALVNPTT